MNEQQIMQALKNADAAGDVEAAKKLAAMLRKSPQQTMEQPQVAPTQTQTQTIAPQEQSLWEQFTPEGAENYNYNSERFLGSDERTALGATAPARRLEYMQQQFGEENVTPQGDRFLIRDPSTGEEYYNEPEGFFNSYNPMDWDWDDITADERGNVIGMGAGIGAGAIAGLLTKNKAINYFGVPAVETAVSDMINRSSREEYGGLESKTPMQDLAKDYAFNFATNLIGEGAGALAKKGIDKASGALSEYKIKQGFNAGGKGIGGDVADATVRAAYGDFNEEAAGEVAAKLADQRNAAQSVLDAGINDLPSTLTAGSRESNILQRIMSKDANSGFRQETDAARRTLENNASTALDTGKTAQSVGSDIKDYLIKEEGDSRQIINEFFEKSDKALKNSTDEIEIPANVLRVIGAQAEGATDVGANKASVLSLIPTDLQAKVNKSLDYLRPSAKDDAGNVIARENPKYTLNELNRVKKALNDASKDQNPLITSKKATDTVAKNYRETLEANLNEAQKVLMDEANQAFINDAKYFKEYGNLAYSGKGIEAGDNQAFQATTGLLDKGTEKFDRVFDGIVSANPELKRETLNQYVRDNTMDQSEYVFEKAKAFEKGLSQDKARYLQDNIDNYKISKGFTEAIDVIDQLQTNKGGYSSLLETMAENNNIYLSGQGGATMIARGYDNLRVAMDQMTEGSYRGLEGRDLRSRMTQDLMSINPDTIRQEILANAEQIRNNPNLAKKYVDLMQQYGMGGDIGMLIYNANQLGEN